MKMIPEFVGASRLQTFMSFFRLGENLKAAVCGAPLDGDTAQNVGEVYVYPHPVVGPEATVHLESGVPDKVRLRIYDLNGALVKESVWLGKPGGAKELRVHEFPLDVSHLDPGTYLYVVSAASGQDVVRVTRRIHIVKAGSI